MSYIGEILGMSPDSRIFKESPKIADNNTYVGVEIELENLAGFHDGWIEKVRSTGLWNVTKDGSLRNDGLEFIMATPDGYPMKGGDITRALFRFRKTMMEYIKAGNEPPDCSPRTSVHVHVDARDLTIDQLKKLILLYVVFEETFFKWCDISRIENNYCRSAALHSDVVDRMADILKTKDADKHVLYHNLMHGNKYDAMNLLSIRQRGSVEFRLMNGTYSSVQIQKWINLLLCLKLAAKDESIVIDSFPDDMSQRGISNLIDQVFGTWGSFLHDVATEGDILHGVRKAQDILLHENINALEKQFANHSPKDSKLLNKFKEML